ncbi:hypothetical protein PN419_13150 [Halorubrum ezzemoulense]|uniref:Uncharacterized protein n=2 Tax=Halorubrum ezzemoulense TaxID=337243 RepID=A0A256KKF0_HALEZ|nr:MULTISPECIES: hypothetical protein [Halorubrum]MDB2223574.1 hypothetical protein [Halorubrum ezzemoulense]MDB2237464.1 hypothetical protein [Halorubrum ezzemoulense]MDB2240938.1 hypothetical protein [Halorubrum ezzemoulense]MDB2243184.1 hypothetical protein [Halorubrum ezzemoulense]MDB2249042.1 hypothetical protein [Halorubrum ezzemoulense]
MFDSLSGPMRSLLARLAFLVAGALVGAALYALGVAGILAVPLAVVALLVIGELYLFAAGQGV